MLTKIGTFDLTVGVMPMGDVLQFRPTLDMVNLKCSEKKYLLKLILCYITFPGTFAPVHIVRIRIG